MPQSGDSESSSNYGIPRRVRDAYSGRVSAIASNAEVRAIQAKVPSMSREDSIRLPISCDAVYLPAYEHRDALVESLAYRGCRVVDEIGGLVFVREASGPAAWAQNSWLAPAEYEIRSIGEVARLLRSIQRNWHLHSVSHHRRARLIADKLPPIRFKPLDFPAAVPSAPLGAFCLLDKHRLLASPVCSSAFVDGVPVFNEDRAGPPNRAYLKLWEALTLARGWPQARAFCLDLGASPSGWTWVLDRLGADILAMDRAGLTPALEASANVTSRQRDAFGLTLDDLDRRPDWVFSDIVAYPERLFELADYWCRACPGAGVILTVKCQGPVEADEVDRFLDIPNGRLLHLAANKHELTFFRLPEGGPLEAAHRPA